MYYNVHSSTKLRYGSNLSVHHQMNGQRICDTHTHTHTLASLPGGSAVKNLPANAGDTGDVGSVSG